MAENTKVRYLNFKKELNIAYNFFSEEGFKIQILNDHNFVARKRGKIFIFFNYIDFYFVRVSPLVKTNLLEDFHIEAIFKVDKLFKIPKFLRTTIPNINTLTISNNIPNQEVIEYISKKRTNHLGGQQESLFVISLFDQKMFSADPSKIVSKNNFLSNSGKLFDILNGNTRSYHLVKNLSINLFNNINKSILKSIITLI